MKRMHIIRVWGVLAVVLAMALVGGTVLAASGQSGRANQVADAHAFWTPERLAAAQPRDIQRAAPPGLIDTNPGKGNGGGGGGGGGKPGGGGDTGGSTDTTGSSWNETGLVQITTGRVFFSIGSGLYSCSGGVVDDADGALGTDANGRTLVVTAGHCVFDETNGAFVTNWVFIPDYDNGGSYSNATGPYGMWAASALVTTTAWASRDFNHDYAFAVVTETQGGQTLEETVGEQAIAFNATGAGNKMHAFGYPAEGKYKGNDLVYCAGTSADDPYGFTDVYLACKMNGGSSGGPWFNDFSESTGTGTVTSVTSFSYVGLNGYLFGPRLGEWASSVYDAALTATGDGLVAAP
jgi:V8-like Glu-specific endopeptidase